MGRHSSGSSGRDPDTSYCTECGTPVDRSDDFCPNCGVHVTTSGRDARWRDRREYADPGEADQVSAAFRRRVSDYVARGWDIEYDGGHEVVLVDRDFGSFLVHFLLFFPTGGIGNLLYAWYRYSHAADRMVLRADEESRRPSRVTDESELPSRQRSEDEEPSNANALLGTALLLFAGLTLAFGSLATSTVFLSVLLLALGLYFFPPTHRRLRDRHPVTAFGATESVDERTVTDPEEPCTVCMGDIDQGVARFYRKEFAIAGLPLFTTEEGENWYCRDCLSMDDPRLERLNVDSPERDDTIEADETLDADEELEALLDDDQPATENASPDEPADEAAESDGPGEQADTDASEDAEFERER